MIGLKLASLRPGMAVTIRFTNTHIVSGVYAGRGNGTIEIVQGDRPSWWKVDMIEEIYRDGATPPRRRRNQNSKGPR